MRRTIVVGCSVLFAVAGGCGGASNPGGAGGTGGASAGGRGGSSTGGSGGTGGSSTGGSGGATTGGSGGSSTGGAGAGGRGGTGGGGTGGTPGPRTVTFASADPLAFAAAQDGSGPWQAFAGGVGPNYALQVTGERYGIAYGCASAAGDAITMTVIQATVSETTRVTVACGGLSTAPLGMITGMVGGFTDPQAARIDVASRGQQVMEAAPTYILSVPTGTFDLFARRMTGSPMFDRMIRRNSVIIGANTTLNLDFTSEGFAPDARTVTFQGVSATETAGLAVIFRNPLGGSSFNLGQFPSGTYLAIPASQLRSGDYHSVVATATESGGGVGRWVRRTYVGTMSFTAVMPPMITPPVLTVGASTPYLRPRGSIPAGLGSDRYDLSYTQADTSTSTTRSRIWAVQLTGGWIAAAVASDYTVPDLSVVAGFQSWWGLAAGSTYWQQFANWSDAGAADLLRADQSPAELDGREYKVVQRTGNATF
jgi:hypothetical protein